MAAFHTERGISLAIGLGEVCSVAVLRRCSPYGREPRLTAPAQETDFGLYHSRAPGRQAPWRKLNFVSGSGSAVPTLPSPSPVTR